MFAKFNTDKCDPPSLTIGQFKKFLFSIGMDFINQQYQSGVGTLFKAED